jgi:hypothetical protein
MSNRLGVAAFIVLGTISWLALAAPPIAPAPSPTPIPYPNVPIATHTKTCGQGVCKRTVPDNAVCTPGAPISANDGWLFAIDAASSSWDANCDGAVEKKPIPVGFDITGCELVRGGCVPRKMIDPACGIKWAAYNKCSPSNGECKPNALIGSITQACR